MKHAIRTAIVFALASLCLCTGASAKVVKFANPPGDDVRPLAMNDKGQVAGMYHDGHAGVVHGFFWRPGSAPVTFDVPGAQTTWPIAISAAGVISGWYFDPDGPASAGFVRAADGTITTFNIGYFTVPAGANEKGWVVGDYSPQAEQPLLPFLRSPSGATKSFQVPGATSAGAVAMNRSRTIAGVAVVAGQNSPQQAFIRPAHGPATLFGDAQASLHVAGINDAGTIAGYYTGEGFVRTSDGTVTTFAAPEGARQIDVTGIDSAGTIAGWFADSNNIPRGFLRAADGTLTPFDVKGANSTEIFAVSPKGAIAGIYGSETGSGMFAGKP